MDVEQGAWAGRQPPIVPVQLTACRLQPENSSSTVGADGAEAVSTRSSLLEFSGNGLSLSSDAVAHSLGPVVHSAMLACSLSTPHCPAAATLPIIAAVVSVAVGSFLLPQPHLLPAHPSTPRVSRDTASSCHRALSPPGMQTHLLAQLDVDEPMLDGGSDAVAAGVKVDTELLALAGRTTLSPLSVLSVTAPSPQSDLSGFSLSSDSAALRDDEDDTKDDTAVLPLSPKDEMKAALVVLWQLAGRCQPPGEQVESCTQPADFRQGEQPPRRSTIFCCYLHCKKPQASHLDLAHHLVVARGRCLDARLFYGDEEAQAQCLLRIIRSHDSKLPVETLLPEQQLLVAQAVSELQRLLTAYAQLQPAKCKTRLALASQGRLRGLPAVSAAVDVRRKLAEEQATAPQFLRHAGLTSALQPLNLLTVVLRIVSELQSPWDGLEKTLNIKREAAVQRLYEHVRRWLSLFQLLDAVPSSGGQGRGSANGDSKDDGRDEERKAAAIPPTFVLMAGSRLLQQDAHGGPTLRQLHEFLFEADYVVTIRSSACTGLAGGGGNQHGRGGGSGGGDDGGDGDGDGDGQDGGNDSRGDNDHQQGDDAAHMNDGDSGDGDDDDDDSGHSERVEEEERAACPLCADGAAVDRTPTSRPVDFSAIRAAPLSDEQRAVQLSLTVVDEYGLELLDYVLDAATDDDRDAFLLRARQAGLIPMARHPHPFTIDPLLYIDSAYRAPAAAQPQTARSSAQSAATPYSRVWWRRPPSPDSSWSPPAAQQLHSSGVPLSSHPYVGMDRYHGFEKIGEGTYGGVYKAEDKATDEIVTLKKVWLETLDGDMPSILMREIRSLKELRHDNIVSLRDLVYEDNAMYLVLEYFEHNLKSYMEFVGSRMDKLLVKSYMYQLLLGVAFCHSQRVVHRDLQPENLLIDRQGRLKLDLSSSVLSVWTFGVWTFPSVPLWYAAPETELGDGPSSTPENIWSVACIFLEMLSRFLLFPGDSDLDQLSRIIRPLRTSEREWSAADALSRYSRHWQWQSQLLNAVRGLTDPLAVDLLEKMLAYEPSRRISATEALSHPYFHEMYGSVRERSQPRPPASSFPYRPPAAYQSPTPYGAAAYSRSSGALTPPPRSEYWLSRAAHQSSLQPQPAVEGAVDSSEFEPLL